MEPTERTIMQKLHEDKQLNKLYNTFAKFDLGNEDHLDQAMLLLDEIMDRRIELGEVDASEI
jgi:hypothetical protein